ncbi:apolipoprotein N-acyltransferase [Pseudodesulfovibrio sp.]|uniref:apolipoprotein N-acyltransferase n=1 Tax=Pseudodesulfovibrio sp. TaxID=2035812 RepID=UPI00260884F2|nr:apolipoprotein N-acyltransferase [Pseudodesulfovibrio sp.]MDD3312053.1 apolipoprotein N-acyltransferase [Pseudodesulfovibrio sp.]
MLKLVLLATLGAWIGFANPVLQFPLAVLAFPVGLAWIGLRATSARKAFLFGWLAGLLACVGCFYWMVIPVQFYGGLPWYVALPCPALLGAFLALYYGLFSLGLHLAGKSVTGVPLCLLAGLTWASLEMLLGSVFTGFPWMNLASAFAPWPLAIQGAALVGAYGLSGVFAALAVAGLLASTYRSALFLTVGLAAAVLGFGYFHLDAQSGEKADFGVSIAQGNVDQAEKWVPAFQARTVEKYAKLTLRAVSDFHPELVVWPETAMPFYLEENTSFRTALEILARDTGTHLIIGAPAYRVIDLQKKDYVLLNRAWLMDETGRTNQSYDKEHLVPFGEYMPLKSFIPFDQLVQAAGNFVPGTDNKPLVIKGVPLGMLICYEAIFPELAQQQVERGAQAIINISNDAWFGDTSAPGQHLDLTAMRAVEQGRWLVRSTNTGISAFIDPAGRVLMRTDQFRAETLSMKIAPRRDTTFFHDNYHLIGRGIYLLTILGFAGILLSHRKRTKETSSNA